MWAQEPRRNKEEKNNEVLLRIFIFLTVPQNIKQIKYIYINNEPAIIRAITRVGIFIALNPNTLYAKLHSVITINIG